MQKVNRVINSIADIGGYFTGVLVLLMMSLIMYEVFMRYVLNKPPAIADEISAYMLIGVVFIGLSYAWKEKGHVRIEFLIAKLPTRTSQWLRLATLIVAFIYIVLASKATYDFVLFSFQAGLRSQTWLRIPLQWPQLPIFIGFSLLALQLVAEIVKAVQDIRSSNGKQAT